MATNTYKVLAQSAPSAASLTDAYTVPALTMAVISTIAVCNRGASATTYRISVAVAGAADAAEQYIAYDAAIAANTSQMLTIGISLGAADVVRVYAGAAQLSFNISGAEVS